MADTSLTFDILARDRASAVIDKVGGATEGLGSKLAKIGAAVGGVIAVKEGIDFLRGSMKDAATEAQNMAVLNHTLDENLHMTDAQKASNEKWITSLQNATGVSRDELEPALGKLIIAGEDLTTAHKNMAIATDIAAARHVDLATVVAGIAKAAATGHTTALGRLGLATKDAAGHTLTLDQVLENAAKTMGGSAAAAADTAAGRAKILGEKFHDVKVQIGDALLPVMGFLTDKLSDLTSWLSDHLPAAIDWTKTKVKELGDWFEEHVLPALTRTADFISDDLIPKFAAVAGYIHDHFISSLQDVAKWFDDHRPILEGILAAIAADMVIVGVQSGIAFAIWVAGAAAAAADTLLAIAPAILVTAAIAGLVAGVIWAYQNWDWFRDAVDRVATFMRDTLWPIMQNIAGWITGTLIPVIGDIITKFLDVVSFLEGLGGDIVGALADVYNAVVGPFKKAFGEVKRLWDDGPGRIPGIGGFMKGAAQSFLGPVAGLPPWGANGFSNFPGGLAVINEHRGGELVDLPRGTNVYPMGETNEIAGLLRLLLNAVDRQTDTHVRIART